LGAPDNVVDPGEGEDDTREYGEVVPLHALYRDTSIERGNICVRRRPERDRRHLL
jgi:hypothetical protein